MKSDPRDYQLDISSIEKPDAAAEAAGSPSGGNALNRPKEPAASAAASKNPYLSVLFSCCQVYQRVYRNADGRDYTGRCPKCARTIRFVVGEGGTSGRSFVVE